MLGPVVGGAFATNASWRWAFLINLPIVAITVAGTRASLRETERQPGRSLPDPPGALLLALASAAAALASSEVTTWGLIDARTLFCMAIAVAAGAVLVARSTTVSDPVLDLALLRDRHFAAVTATTVLYAAAFFGLLFSFVLFLTTVWHLTTIQAGLGITPMAGTVMPLSRRVGRLPDRVGFGPPLAGGAAIIGARLRDPNHSRRVPRRVGGVGRLRVARRCHGGDPAPARAGAGSPAPARAGAHRTCWRRAGRSSEVAAGQARRPGHGGVARAPTPDLLPGARQARTRRGEATCCEEPSPGAAAPLRVSSGRAGGRGTLST